MCDRTVLGATDADAAMRHAASEGCHCTSYACNCELRNEDVIRKHIAPVIAAKDARIAELEHCVSALKAGVDENSREVVAKDAEIERWKSAYHRELQAHDNTKALRAVLRADRDEWKRRAEAAEAQLVKAREDTARLERECAAVRSCLERANAPRANHLWPPSEGSIEALGYEFANSKTEEYSEEMWKALIDAAREKGGAK